MGGLGRGDWANALTRKDSIDCSKVLSIKMLKKYGFLDADKAGVVDWTNVAGEILCSVKVKSVLGDTPLLLLSCKNVEQKIKLTKTPCHYGGFRWWFECPVVKDGVYCGNRSSKLYLPPRQVYFGCRGCYDLTYESCQTSHKYDNLDEHLQNMDIDSLSVTQALRLGGL
jgi:hypothetical protein